MMHDRRPPEEAADWLRFAATDLAAARVLLSTEPPYLRQSLQSAQQSVEKALKALLIAKEQSYPLTHNLEHLRRLCCDLDPSLDPIASRCLDLSPYASLMRYPGEEEEPAIDQAREWVAAAADLLDAVSSRTGTTSA